MSISNHIKDHAILGVNPADYEPVLGSPIVDGYVLASKKDGTRSWIIMSTDSLWESDGANHIQPRDSKLVKAINLDGALLTDQTIPQVITGDTPKLDVLKSKTILGTDADGKIIEGTHQDLSGYVPYSGATDDVDLGANNLTVDTNTLFVDAVNDRVGIGTTAPRTNLDTNGVIRAVGGSYTAVPGGGSDTRTDVGMVIPAGMSYSGEWNGYIRNLIKWDSDDRDIDIGQAGTSLITNINLIAGNAGNIRIPRDNSKLYFGTGDDASIYYDSSNMLINPALVGTGKLLIGNYTGALQAGIQSAMSTWNTGFIRADGINAVGTLTCNNGAVTRGVTVFARTRGTPAIPTAVVDDDYLGDLLWGGYDGASLQYGAGVFAFVDGAVSSGSVPIRISFVTGTSAATRKERLKVDYLGNILLTTDCAGLKFQKDNGKIFLGAGDDASISYDGTNLIINPKEVGSGILDVQGVLQTDGYNSADGTAGISTTFVDAGGNTITVKDGLITAKTAP
jgi:hypothetical protein